MTDRAERRRRRRDDYTVQVIHMYTRYITVLFLLLLLAAADIVYILPYLLIQAWEDVHTHTHMTELINYRIMTC